MTKRTKNQERVDQYLRGKLSTPDVEAFELELMDSIDLQQELETTLALRGAMAFDAKRQPASNVAELLPESSGPSAWRRLAMAAAIALAVLSTLMWWKTGSDLVDLEGRMEALAAPLGEVLAVPVPVMRSSGGQTPDVMVQKPEGRTAILLDIELGLAARERNSLEFALVDPQGETVLSWQSAPNASGHATAVVSSEQVPASRLWLQISDATGDELERRLLEFR